MTDQLTLIEFKEITKKLRPRKNKKKEENLQLRVCAYLKLKYPNAIFSSDVASGMKLPIHIAAKCKQLRSERGLPDLLIFEPKGNHNAGTYYCGLALELKNQRSDVYLKDGTISEAKSSDHVREQSEILKRLRDRNWFADFSFGWDDTKNKIDTYFNL